MATTITSLTELVPAETIGEAVMEYAHDAMPVAGLCREVQMPLQGGKVYAWPRWVQDAHEDITTEGTTAITDTELETTESTTTIAQIGLGRQLTKFVQKTNQLGPAALLQHLVMDAATTLAPAIEDDIVALFASITDSVGTSGVDFSVTNYLQALAEQRTNNVIGQLEFILADIQVTDLQASGGASGAATLTSNGASIVNANTGGFQGTLFGANIWRSSLCDTANANADRVGACINNGRLSPTRPSLGLVMLWFGEMEPDKDIWLLTDKFAWSAAYGCTLVGDAYSCKIVTDA